MNPRGAQAVHVPAKAKSVIYLFMAGAPSQVDLFDFKPTLQKYDGQTVPEELMKGERFAFIKGTARLLGSPYEFHAPREIRRGNFRASAAAGEQWPTTSPLCNSIHTTQFNHRAGADLHEYGFSDYRAAEYGVLVTYGLGSECHDLPGFVVLISGENQPDGGKACWGSGFLPTVYQGVAVSLAGRSGAVSGESRTVLIRRRAADRSIC